MTPDDPAPLPTFFDLFNKPAPPPPSNGTPLPPSQGTSRYAAAALKDECAGVAAQTKPGRNVALNKAAYKIAQLVAGGHLPHTEAWEALTAAAKACQLPDAEIYTTLTSAFGAGTLQPRIVPEQPVPPVTLLVTPQPDTLPINPRLDWHHLFTTDGDEEEWIVEPLLPARRMIALYSAAKVGKSLLMLELAAAIARGAPTLGKHPQPHRVLYVDFENDPHGDIKTRLEDMNITADQLGNLVYLSFPSLAKFDTAAGAVDLMRHVEHYDCEVVVIDTVSRAVMGEENDNDTWLAFYRHTGIALKRAGVACIRLDHSGKDRERGMRGGSAKTGDVDAVWQLTTLNDTTVRLECTHHRMPVPVKILTLTRTTDGPLEHRVAKDAYATASDAITLDYMQRLDQLKIPRDAGYRPCTQALEAIGMKVKRDPLREAVRNRKTDPPHLLLP